MTPYYFAVGVLFAGWGLFDQHEHGASTFTRTCLIMGGIAFLATAISALTS